jgi:hypothetical protein
VVCMCNAKCVHVPTTSLKKYSNLVSTIGIQDRISNTIHINLMVVPFLKCL